MPVQNNYFFHPLFNCKKGVLALFFEPEGFFPRYINDIIILNERLPYILGENVMNQRRYERQYHELKEKKEQFFGPDRKMIGFYALKRILTFANLFTRFSFATSHFIFFEPDLTVHIIDNSDSLSRRQHTIHPREIKNITIYDYFILQLITEAGFTILICFLISILFRINFFYLFLMLIFPCVFIMEHLQAYTIIEIITNKKNYKYTVCIGALWPYQSKALTQLENYIKSFEKINFL